MASHYLGLLLNSFPARDGRANVPFFFAVLLDFLLLETAILLANPAAEALLLVCRFTWVACLCLTEFHHAAALNLSLEGFCENCKYSLYRLNGIPLKRGMLVTASINTTGNMKRCVRIMLYKWTSFSTDHVNLLFGCLDNALVWCLGENVRSQWVFWVLSRKIWYCLDYWYL